MNLKLVISKIKYNDVINFPNKLVIRDKTSPGLTRKKVLIVSNNEKAILRVCLGRKRYKFKF